MAEYVFTKIMFSPEHKEHFYKILTECEKDEVHPKAACNKEGRFYKADFEKIIPLPYYWWRINDRISNGTLIKEIREEFDTFLDIINKSPNENNIEVIIKSFIGFIKKAIWLQISRLQEQTLHLTNLKLWKNFLTLQPRKMLKGENLASERKFPAMKLCLC
jgi:hypothetical protein